MTLEQEAEVEAAFERLKYSGQVALDAIQARINEIRITRIYKEIECQK